MNRKACNNWLYLPFTHAETANWDPFPNRLNDYLCQLNEKPIQNSPSFFVFAVDFFLRMEQVEKEHGL